MDITQWYSAPGFNPQYQEKRWKDREVGRRDRETKRQKDREQRDRDRQREDKREGRRMNL